MRNKIIDSEEYYRKIKELNIEHYAGEIDYYSKAQLRPVENHILDSLRSGSRILDLGCGSGRFSVGAAKKGFEVVGIDITNDAIEASRKRADEAGLKNVEFICGDMIDIPFSDDEFDYVFCPRFSINAVATFQKRRKAVEEMFRVVKEGGKVHIESFNKLYFGTGVILPIKNLLRDAARSMKMLISRLKKEAYEGLLPGDIVYEANKVEGASKGYAHLPTVFELKKLIPEDLNNKMYSIPQIRDGKKFDIFKYMRYSIWIFIQK